MTKSLIRIEYSKDFNKQLLKAPLQIKKSFRKKLSIFLEDRFHPLLNNHVLIGKYSGHRSINVTGDWRAIFREFGEENLIYFDAIGTHSQLYK